MTSPRLGDPLFPGVEDTRWPARVSTFWAESAPSPQKSPEIPKSEFSWLTRPFFHPVSTLFINMYKRTTEKVPAQSVQILKSDFRTVMHQLGPFQRVPSPVEARRASLTRSDTLFTHPYSCSLTSIESPWHAAVLGKASTP